MSSIQEARVSIGHAIRPLACQTRSKPASWPRMLQPGEGKPSHRSGAPNRTDKDGLRPQVDVQGLGGGFAWVQRVACNLDLGGLAACQDTFEERLAQIMEMPRGIMGFD